MAERLLRHHQAAARRGAGGRRRRRRAVPRPSREAQRPGRGDGRDRRRARHPQGGRHPGQLRWRARRRRRQPRRARRRDPRAGRARTGAARRRSSTRSSAWCPRRVLSRSRASRCRSGMPGRSRARRRAAHLPGAADLRPPVVHRGRARLDLGPPAHRASRRRGSCARSSLRRERARWAIAVDALTRVGLGDLAEQPAGRLTYGQRRLLELARAIAADPRVLLLDEPSAGLDASETETLAGYLVDLRDEGVSLLVIDHKLDFITGSATASRCSSWATWSPSATPPRCSRTSGSIDAYLGVATRRVGADARDPWRSRSRTARCRPCAASTST